MRFRGSLALMSFGVLLSGFVGLALLRADNARPPAARAGFKPAVARLALDRAKVCAGDAVGIGTALAERLDQLMRGRHPGPAPRVKPLGVVERESTAWGAATDPHMVKALAFIRNTAGRQITVEEVARADGVCRRALEYLFREHFQSSVAAFLRRRMVDSIKNLLIHTDYPLERITEILGSTCSNCMPFSGDSRAPRRWLTVGTIAGRPKNRRPKPVSGTLRSFAA